MTTASNARVRAATRLATAFAFGAAAASAAPLRAAFPAIDEGDAGPGLFSFGYMSAFDYILLGIALVVGIATGFFYYRSTLLDAVNRMQTPSKVKLRAIGLGLAAFALLLMLSPALPIGVLLILAVAGLLIALVAGVGLIAAAVVVVLVLIMFALWFSGALGNLFAG